MNNLKTTILGYPRMGGDRELKKAVESFWKGDTSIEDLQKLGASIRKANWETQRESNLDFIPSNDFSFYDQMLDMTCLLGNVPERFNWDRSGNISSDIYFSIARGNRKDNNTKAQFASEMTKWFDTNYHYIVPEFTEKTTFRLSSTKLFDEYKEAKELGIETRPVLIGPVTYLKLGKSHEGLDVYSLYNQLLPVYKQILNKLSTLGVEWVQFDEPIFSLDLTDQEKDLLTRTYSELEKTSSNIKIFVTNYFGDLRDNKDLYLNLPVSAIHFDLQRAGDEFENIAAELPTDKVISLGLVNGRNIWVNNYENSLRLIELAKKVVKPENIWISGSCSLLHSPVSLKREEKLDANIKQWLSFAEEKLLEIKDISELAVDSTLPALSKNKLIIESRKSSDLIHNKAVKDRVSKIKIVI